MTLQSSHYQQTGLVYISPSSFAKSWFAGQRLWVRPVGIALLAELSCILTEDAVLSLAGGPYGFTHLDLVIGTSAGGYKATRVSLNEARVITGGAVKASWHDLRSAPCFCWLTNGQGSGNGDCECHTRQFFGRWPVFR